jgi:putative DNA primase/helicase
MPAARAMVEDCHTTDSVRTMHRYRGTFWKWYGSCYRERNPESVSAHVWKYLERSRKEATNRKGVTFITDFAPTNTNGR